MRNARKDEEGQDDEGDSKAESEIWRSMVGSWLYIEEEDVSFDDDDDIAGMSNISDNSDEEIQEDDIGEGQRGGCGGGRRK